MQISLYQAAEEVRHLLEQIDPETGEISEGLDQARSIVATKSKAVAAFILENDKQADYVEQHAKALLDRVKAARKRSEWLKGYLSSHMKACGILSIKSDDGMFHAKLELDRDKSVEIFDEEQLPKDYLREVPAKEEPDKKLIKKALDDGFDVPGARMAAKDRLTLR